MTNEEIVAAMKELAAATAKLRSPVEVRKPGKKQPPYYNEKHAELVKEKIDLLYSRGTPVIIPTDGKALNTVRLMFYQGLDYLLNNLDEDGNYAMRRTNMDVSFSSRDYGVLQLKRRHGILPVDFEWRPRVIQYMKDAKKYDKLELYGAHFVAEDYHWVDDLVKPETEYMKSFDWAGMSGFTVIKMV